MFTRKVSLHYTSQYTVIFKYLFHPILWLLWTAPKRNITEAAFLQAAPLASTRFIKLVKLNFKPEILLNAIFYEVSSFEPK